MLPLPISTTRSVIFVDRDLFLKFLQVISSYVQWIGTNAGIWQILLTYIQTIRYVTLEMCSMNSTSTNHWLLPDSSMCYAGMHEYVGNDSWRNWAGCLQTIVIINMQKKIFTYIE